MRVIYSLQERKGGKCILPHHWWFPDCVHFVKLLQAFCRDWPVPDFDKIGCQAQKIPLYWCWWCAGHYHVLLQCRHRRCSCYYLCFSLLTEVSILYRSSRRFAQFFCFCTAHTPIQNNRFEREETNKQTTKRDYLCPLMAHLRGLCSPRRLICFFQFFGWIPRFLNSIGANGRLNEKDLRKVLMGILQRCVKKVLSSSMKRCLHSSL